MLRTETYFTVQISQQVAFHAVDTIQATVIYLVLEIKGITNLQIQHH